MFKNLAESSITKCDVTLFGTSIEGMQSNFAVYECWKAGTLIYIGVAKFSQFHLLPDATRNSYFAALVKSDEPIDIRIIATGHKVDCVNHRMSLLRSMTDTPPANRYGSYGQQMRIQCIEDGKIYRTQQEAAQAYGIAQGNLSHHLRGSPGYPKVGGRTFKRVM